MEEPAEFLMATCASISLSIILPAMTQQKVEGHEY